jgi:recombinational DNA repair protein (RecF pathway)
MKYVHWDLHQNNVLMRELNVDNAYIYLPNENEYLWVGTHLATIIDYGLSSFEYKGKNISRCVYQKYGLNPELSTSPLNDFFKLINSFYSMTFNDYRKDKMNRIALEKFKAIQKIYGYFLGTNDGDEIDAIQKAADETYSIFPNAPNYTISDFVKNTGSNVTLDDIIKMVKSLGETQHLNLFTKNKPATVLSCDAGRCLDEYTIEKVIMSREVPVSLQEASLLSSRLKNRNEKDQEYQKEKKILDKFLVDYVDKIYNIVQSYLVKKPNVSVDMIYLFNDLRLMEHQLRVLEIIMKDSDNKELLDRIQEQKEVIYKLVNDIYQNVEKSLQEKESDYNRTTYKPMSVEGSSYLLLQNAFEDLALKAKNPSPKTKREEEKVQEKVQEKSQDPVWLFGLDLNKDLKNEEEEATKIEEMSADIQPSSKRLQQPSKSSHISSIVIPVPPVPVPAAAPVPLPVVPAPAPAPVPFTVAAPAPVPFTVPVPFPVPFTVAVPTPAIAIPPIRRSTRVTTTRSKSEMTSSIPLPTKQGSVQITGSSLPVESYQSSKNLFVSQLKKYEQLLNGQKGVFIKSNLRKGKVQNMYNFVIENKDLVNADASLKSDIKRKMELIKNLDGNYEDMIDQYMKQLNL